VDRRAPPYHSGNGGPCRSRRLAQSRRRGNNWGRKSASIAPYGGICCPTPCRSCAGGCGVWSGHIRPIPNAFSSGRCGDAGTNSALAAAIGNDEPTLMKPGCSTRAKAGGALSAVGAGEEVVPTSDYRALQHQVREPQRLLSKKTLENEILRDALDLAQPKNGRCTRPRRYETTPPEGDRRTLGVARSNLVAQAAATPCRRGRPPQPEADLLAEIKQVIAGQPTYGYRRGHALFPTTSLGQGGAIVNVKRLYRIMKTHGLLLECHTGNDTERRHDGRVAVARPDTRRCSDAFEIGCDNGERARIAFTLDCCDRQAISWVTITGGIDSGDIRDLMIENVERRFGLVNRLPAPIEWLSDNGSPYTARETRRLAREIGLVPRTTPIESPQSNGMAEAFVKTLKRDHASVNLRPDAASLMRQLDRWFEHYNTVHPHKALGYRSPREFRKQLVEATTENAVGAVRRPHEGTLSTGAIESSPPAAYSGNAQHLA
jgi:putative transposase